jgi:hypothetical protein
MGDDRYLAIRIPAALLPDLKVFAEEKGLPVPDLVREVLADYIAHARPVGQQAGPVVLSADPLVLVDSRGSRTKAEWVSLAKQALGGT